MGALMCQIGINYVYDDVSNAALVPDLVHKARALEMKLFSDMVEYTRVPISDQLKTKGHIIKTPLDRREQRR